MSFAFPPPAAANRTDSILRDGNGWLTTLRRDLEAFGAMGFVVLLASLAGLTTLHAFSLSFWPANAVLVGLMIRRRRFDRATGWAGAMLGYIAADIIYGRTLPVSTMFACANMTSALAATFLLGRLDPRDLKLRRVYSVLRLLACLVPAALAGGSMGALLVVVVFHGSPLQTIFTWPAAELVNYLVMLPTMLTFSLRLRDRRTARLDVLPRPSPAPVLALILSCAAAAACGGPGAIMFPMPALLWCALTYTIPQTSLISMLVGSVSMTTIGLGLVDIGQDVAVPRLVVSIRIAVAFMMLAPLTIASVMVVRDDLMGQLRDSAERDGLTGLLNRSTFEAQLDQRLSALGTAGEGLALLWLDIDRFKQINDTFGHPAGDAVLRHFAATARLCCREGDLIGRIGGEEFALALTMSGPNGALAAAERLRRTFAEQATMWEGVPIAATISTGASYIRGPVDLAVIAQRLDKALYRAKRNGRNRIEWVQY